MTFLSAAKAPAFASQTMNMPSLFGGHTLSFDVEQDIFANSEASRKAFPQAVHSAVLPRL